MKRKEKRRRNQRQNRNSWKEEREDVGKGEDEEEGKKINRMQAKRRTGERKRKRVTFIPLSSLSVFEMLLS